MGRITAEIAPGTDHPTLDSIKQRNTRNEASISSAVKNWSRINLLSESTSVRTFYESGPTVPPVSVFTPLVLSFFINPIGVSDQAWGTIVTFTVRVLVPGP